MNFHDTTGCKSSLLLLVLHPLDVLGEGGELPVGRHEAEELGEAGPVGGVLHHAQLDVGRVLLPELGVLEQEGS